jgi:hypothetical protein
MCKKLVDIAGVRGGTVIVLADKRFNRERTYWQKQSGIATSEEQQPEEEEQLTEEEEAVRARVKMYNVRPFEDLPDGVEMWLPANIC